MLVRKIIEPARSLPYLSSVNLFKLLPLFLCLVAPVLATEGGSTKIIKVLPQLVDREGRHSLSPSLYARDAYQAILRTNPVQRAGIRFAVQWKGPRQSRLTLRVEMRGMRGKEATTALLEASVARKGWFSTWSTVALEGEPYKNLGEMAAWRATLWDGNRQVAEQRSFMW